MQSLRVFIRNFLHEGKIEVLQQEYPNLNIKKISERDPSRSNKYLAWMVKQLSLGTKEVDLLSNNFVVLNPNISIETLKKVVKSKYWNYWQIRVNVASNPNTPKEILKQLTNDKHQNVRNYAKRMLRERSNIYN